MSWRDFAAGITDILGGVRDVEMQQKVGYDWREKRDQERFLRQQQREQARQQNEAAELAQDERLQGQLVDVLQGAQEGEQPDLESMLPQNIEYLRRQRIIQGAVGAGKERKSALQAQRFQAEQERERVRQQGRMDALTKTQEFQDAQQEERLNAAREGRQASMENALKLTEMRLGAQRANMEYRTAHPGAGAGGKLRVEFNREIKPYRTIQENFQRLNAAASDPSGANDVAIIFNYMKMLDPASVVREGEFATAQDAGINVPDRVWQMYRRVRAGERLTPGQRRQFLASGRQQYQSSALPAIRQLTTQYGRLAENSGMDPQDIIGGFVGDSSDAPEAPPMARPSGAPRISSAAEYAALPSGTVYMDPNGRRRRKP